MPRRIAVIADVHANLPALTAVLAASGEEGCEAVYCLGDIIGIGPYPAECLNLLLRTPSTRFVMGNHDAWFANGLPDPCPAWMTSGEAAHHRWTHAQLEPALREVVADWPYVRQLNIGVTPATFLHYALNKSGRDFASIVPAPTPTELDALFGAWRTPLVCYGHHHPTADAQGASRYINPGSLGCSSDSLARYAVVETDDNGPPRVQFQAAGYDRTELIRQFEERGVPDREFLLAAFFGHEPGEPA